MNAFTKDSFKKLLFLYLVALILVAVYFLVSILLQDEKSIQLKSFKHSADEPLQEKVIQQEEQTKEESPFLMLPKK